MIPLTQLDHEGLLRADEVISDYVGGDMKLSEILKDWPEKKSEFESVTEHQSGTLYQKRFRLWKRGGFLITVH